MGKRGLIRAGGGGGRSTSQISSNHDSTNPVGGDIVESANSRRPVWSPCVQAYPPLGSQRTIQSSESIEGLVGGRGRLCRPARPNRAQIDPAVKDVRAVSEI